MNLDAINSGGFIYSSDENEMEVTVTPPVGETFGHIPLLPAYKEGTIVRLDLPLKTISFVVRQYHGIKYFKPLRNKP